MSSNNAIHFVSVGGVIPSHLGDHERYPGLLERLVKDWLPFLEQGFATAGERPQSVRPMATLTYTAVRGLQVDLLATGERDRVDAAFSELLRMLSEPSPLGAGSSSDAALHVGTDEP